MKKNQNLGKMAIVPKNEVNTITVTSILVLAKCTDGKVRRILVDQTQEFLLLKNLEIMTGAVRIDEQTLEGIEWESIKIERPVPLEKKLITPKQ